MAIFTNYHGFDHAAVDKKFSGGLTFVNTIQFDQDVPWAVYRSANPDREKGHKDFMLLSLLSHVTKDGEVVRQGIVNGKSPEQLEKFRYAIGAECLDCKDIVVSRGRHDMAYCTCKEIAIDGGRAYTKISGDPRLLFVDLVEGKEVNEEEYRKHNPEKYDQEPTV